MKPLSEFTVLLLSVIGTTALIGFLTFINNAHTCAELACAVNVVMTSAKF